MARITNHLARYDEAIPYRPNSSTEEMQAQFDAVPEITQRYLLGGVGTARTRP